MLCEDIMKSEVTCITPQDTVQSAARRMREENIGFLPVCDSSGRILGTITDRDMALRVLSDGRPASTTVGDVMTREVIACRPDDELIRAEELMAQNHKSRIMVTEGNRLVGVISLSDIAKAEDGPRASQTLRRVSEREIHA